jgi:hypothetical protein
VRAANRMTHRPDSVLIRSKFSRPPGRPDFVQRPRLLDRLDRAVVPHRVILVSARPSARDSSVSQTRVLIW